MTVETTIQELEEKTMSSSKKKLTQKIVKEIFEEIEAHEENYVGEVCAIDTRLKEKFGDKYEIAWVGGEVIGIGMLTKDGRKLIYHR